MFEDALAGVEAGRAGHFGCVVGVDRVGQAEALKAHGADRVVKDLGELLPAEAAHRDPPPGVRRRTAGRIVEEQLHYDILAQTESVFALSNGHIGLRGNLDEGEPHGLPGHLPGLVLRAAPAVVGRAGCTADPNTSQTVVNVTNGKIIRLLVDDEPFDIRYGELRHHRTGPGSAGRHAHPDGRVGVARDTGPCGCGPPGWCR